MLFPTFEFFTFFTLVLILNWSLKRWSLVWRLFLLTASYFFYSSFDLRFLAIIVAVSLFNFFSALAIHRNFLGKRKLILTAAVMVDILFLGFFKYYDFFRVSFESLLGKLQIPANLPLLEIILPIGLSFYIFRVISYNADVYLGKTTPTASVLDFCIYVAFFPQLLAGPIMKAEDFLTQLKNGGAKKIANLHKNLTLIIIGLFKKLVISGYLILNITDDVFAVPENHSPIVILLAILSYTLVIYFDFSGYSDMSIGFAGLMGFYSPTNFNAPYLALNIQDFWRRWHITFSNWIRDYIYIPLGGNRKGSARKYGNLIIAMTIAGLWHGAATHFIVWGGLNGLALAAFHFQQDIKAKISHVSNAVGGLFFNLRSNIIKLVWWALTFSFVSFSWIFFRSNSLGDALNLIKSLFNFDKGLEPIKSYMLILMAIGFLLFIFEKQIVTGLTVFQEMLFPIPLALFIIFVMILIFKLGPDIIPGFIYFNF